MLLRPMLKFYGVVVVLATIVLLTTGHVEPLLGAIISGAIQLGIVAWAESLE